MEPLGCDQQNLECGFLQKINCKEVNRQGDEKSADSKRFRRPVNQLQCVDITLVLIQMSRLFVL